MDIKESIARYKECSGHSSLCLKAVLFDMDGVLFDSMPYHVDAWKKVVDRHQMPISEQEIYMNEGRTGANTIELVHMRTFGTHAPEALIKSMYQEKCDEFSKHPEPGRIPGALELLQKVKASGLIPVLVTGSGQASLLTRLNRDYSGIFSVERMVTAHDVKYGKPNPEPYLMGLEKAGVKPWEAIVVENAPIGVKAGTASGTFTIAVNTGPLDPEVLKEEGANLVFDSMHELLDAWQHISENFR